jgi:hypothetical protein
METRYYLVQQLEKLMRATYGWLSENDESLGKITYIVHIFSLLLIIILVIVSHLVYPVIWFQTLVFLVVFTVWIQHILLHACICSVLEIKLMGRKAHLAIDIILDIFKIPVSKETRMGITVLMSTSAVFFLGIELLSRCIMYIRELNNISLWA